MKGFSHGGLESSRFTNFNMHNVITNILPYTNYNNIKLMVEFRLTIHDVLRWHILPPFDMQ